MSPQKYEKILEQITAYCTVELHMREAIDGCMILEKLEESGILTAQLAHCLMTGIVCTYARSFGGNDGLRGISDKFAKFDDEKFRTTHENLLMSRNRMYGHRDFKHERTLIDQCDHDRLDNVRIIVHPNGSTEWEIGRVETMVSSVPLIEQLCKFQKQRFGEMVHNLIGMCLGDSVYMPGIYVLGDKVERVGDAL